MAGVGSCFALRLAPEAAIAAHPHYSAQRRGAIGGALAPKSSNSTVADSNPQPRRSPSLPIERHRQRPQTRAHALKSPAASQPKERTGGARAAAFASEKLRSGGLQDVAPLAIYHGEIGREATAVAEMLSQYHGEIGREATAQEHEPAAECEPTTRKSVGKPASHGGGTAPSPSGLICAYTGASGVTLRP